MKKIFTTTTSGTTTSHDRPVRTFDNSSNSSSTPATNSNAGGNSGGLKVQAPVPAADVVAKRKIDIEYYYKSKQ